MRLFFQRRGAMEDIVLDDFSNKLFIINQITVDRIFSSDNPADNFSLYSFYYKTAKWQNMKVSTLRL